MRNQNWRRVIVAAIAALLTVSFMTTAQALTTAGSERPTTVPADYVITPFGYFHPTCVAQLAKGDVVRQDEHVITHADGTYDNMHVCAFEHYKADGEKVTGDERAVGIQPTISHAWVENASTTTTSFYTYMNAEWNVPPGPSTKDGQTLFLFNGLEDYNDVITILQPVLGWNSDYASAWGIASWNCCTAGTVYEATPAKVNSGDLIQGYMSLQCPRGRKFPCTSWNIVTYDVTSGKSSQLLNTSSQGQTFNWAFGGVLEVYGIVQCGDYPSNGAINFYDQVLWDNNFTPIAAPNWTMNNLSSGLTPQCSYGGSLPQEVILTY